MSIILTLKVCIHKLSSVINRMASRHILDRSLIMVDFLNSTQRDRDIPSDDSAFKSSHGQVVDQCIDNLLEEYE